MTRNRLPWIAAAFVAAAYLLTLASLRIPQRSPQPLVAAHEEASPWVDTFAAYQPTMLAHQATADAVIAAMATQASKTHGVVGGINTNVQVLRWPSPTSTAPIRCTSGTPEPMGCAGAMSTPMGDR